MASTKPHKLAIRDQIDVLSVAEGFFSSAVLFVLLRLRVFELIGDGRMSLKDLSARIDGEPGRLERLLNAGVVLGLLQADKSGYSVTPAHRSVLLPAAGEDYLGGWIRNMEYFRLALSKLDEAVMTGKPTVDPEAHIGSSPSETRDFTLAMHNYASMRGRELAHFLDTRDAKNLLDLGCGPGTYAFHLAQANPSLEIYLLDLPGVLDVAREVQGMYKMENEVNYLPVDVTREEIPGKYDIVLVSNTLHMLGEQKSRTLIRRLYDVVAPGGSLVIQAQYLSDDRQGPRWPVYLDLIQMCITEDGRNHSQGETRGWMEDAGFVDVSFHPMTLFNTNSFLRGYKR